MTKIIAEKFPVVSEHTGIEYFVRIRDWNNESMYSAIFYIPCTGKWKKLKKWKFIGTNSSLNYVNRHCSTFKINSNMFDHDFVNFAKWSIHRYEEWQEELKTRKDKKKIEKLEIQRQLKRFEEWDGR